MVSAKGANIYFTNVSEVRTASIIRDETSVDNYFTRQYIPEDNSELYTKYISTIHCLQWFVTLFNKIWEEVFICY
jgi:hypothetical protein